MDFILHYNVHTTKLFKNTAVCLQDVWWFVDTSLNMVLNQGFVSPFGKNLKHMMKHCFEHFLAFSLKSVSEVSYFCWIVLSQTSLQLQDFGSSLTGSTAPQPSVVRFTPLDDVLNCTTYRSWRICCYCLGVNTTGHLQRSVLCCVMAVLEEWGEPTQYQTGAFIVADQCIISCQQRAHL